MEDGWEGEDDWGLGMVLTEMVRRYLLMIGTKVLPYDRYEDIPLILVFTKGYMLK